MPLPDIWPKDSQAVGQSRTCSAARSQPHGFRNGIQDFPENRSPKIKIFPAFTPEISGGNFALNSTFRCVTQVQHQPKQERRNLLIYMEFPY